MTGLAYTRHMSLRDDIPCVDSDYVIENTTGETKHFLWKLHAALVIGAGDRIECPAEHAQVADREWSRWKSNEPFSWPLYGGERTDIIPEKGDSCDYMYLYGLREGILSLCRKNGLEFTYLFDTAVFPCVHYFASYGGLNGHYTAVLEPATMMPYSVAEAVRLNRSFSLGPKEKLTTRVTVYAGPCRK